MPPTLGASKFLLPPLRQVIVKCALSRFQGSSGGRYDVIFDIVGKSRYFSSLRALNPGGRYLVADGTIRIVVDRRFSLAETADAHRYVETGRKMGDVNIVDQAFPGASSRGLLRLSSRA